MSRLIRAMAVQAVLFTPSIYAEDVLEAVEQHSAQLEGAVQAACQRIAMPLCMVCALICILGSVLSSDEKRIREYKGKIPIILAMAAMAYALPAILRLFVAAGQAIHI